MIPRLGRGSGTRSRFLIEPRIEVGPEPLELDGRSVAEHGGCGFCCNELTLFERHQLSDWDSVARNDEGVSAVERPHDLAAFVP